MTKKRFALVALCLVMVMSLAFLAGCKPEPEPEPEPPICTDVSILANWQPNPQEEVYVVSKVGETTKIAYEKAGEEWAFAARNLATEAEKLTSAYTKLAIKAKLVVTLGQSKVMFKFEGTKGLVKADANALAFESGIFKMSATAATYELDVSGLDLTKATRLLVFVAPGSVAATGSMIIESADFKQAATAGATKIDKVDAPARPAPVVNKYVSGDKFDINANWYDLDGDVYTISTAAGVKTVDFKKFGSYQFFKSVVANINSFDFINVSLKGGAADKKIEVLVKENSKNVEKKLSLDGTKQDVTFDLRGYTTAQKTALTEVLVCVAPGSSATGTFTIELAEFSNVALVEPPKTNPYIKGASYDINKLWTDGGDGVYTIKVVEGKTKIDWAKTAHEWTTAKTPISGPFGSFDQVVIKATSAKGAKVMFKVDSNPVVEKHYTFTTDAEETIIIDLSTKSAAQRATAQNVLLFGNPGDLAGTGTITINSAVFSHSNLAYVSGETFDISNADKWNDNGDGFYTITEVAGKTNIAWAKKGAEWATAKIGITGDLSAFKTLTITVKAAAGTKGMFKMANIEKAFEIKAGETAATVTYSALTADQLKSINEVLLFGSQGVADGTGSIEITSAIFAK